jgi:hypothetical protein
MKLSRLTQMIVALACAFPIAATSQVVREEGAKSIAGVIYTEQYDPSAAAAEWTFQSAGNEVLFASLDADIYRKPPQHSDHSVAGVAAAEDGCSDDGGGAGLFTLKVLDQHGVVLCEATRPAPPPGWQRDPRLACKLPVTSHLPATKRQATYKIRVEFSNPTGETVQPYYPFVLNLSLRRIAPSGSNIQAAIAASSSGGF